MNTFHSLSDFIKMNKSNIILEVPQLSGIRLFYEVIDEKGCKVGGMLGEHLKYSVINPIKEAGYNCTLVSRTMNQNSDDADISYFDIPGVDNKVVLSDQKLAIISWYHSSLDIERQDILGLFFGLNWECYVLVMFIYLSFSFFWSYLEMKTKEMRHELASKFVNARKSGLWLMLCALLDEDQYPDIAIAAFKILGFCFTFFFWAVIDQYLIGEICTGMVVFKEPPVVRSVEDFIKQKRYMPQIPYAKETSFFRDAEKGTLEEIAGRRIIDYPSQIERAIVFMEGFKNGTYASWIRISGANAMGSFISSNREALGLADYRGLIYPDQSNKRVTYSFTYRSGLRFIDKFLDRYRKSLESGIMKYLLEDCFSNTGGEFTIADPNLMGSRVMYDDMPLPFIELSMLYSFLSTLLALMTLSSFVLIREMILSKKNKVGPKKWALVRKLKFS